MKSSGQKADFVIRGTSLKAGWLAPPALQFGPSKTSNKVRTGIKRFRYDEGLLHFVILKEKQERLYFYLDFMIRREVSMYISGFDSHLFEVGIA